MAVAPDEKQKHPCISRAWQSEWSVALMAEVWEEGFGGGQLSGVYSVSNKFLLSTGAQ